VEEKIIKKTKCIRITEDTHSDLVGVAGSKIKIGAYADEAIREKIKREKSKQK